MGWLGMSTVIRRLSGFIAVFLVCLAPSLASPALASAQGAGTLFAIHDGTVVSVDPASSVRTVVATLGPAGTLFADPGSPLLYATVLCSPCRDGSLDGQEVVTVNTLTGAVQLGTVITQQFIAMAFDPNTKALWGIAPTCFPCMNPSIVRVDTVTGAETNVTFPTVNPVFYSLSSMASASATHTLYITFGYSGGNQLFAMNEMTSAVTNIGTLSAPLTNLVYDDKAGQLFGLTANCSFPGVDCALDPDPQLVRVDPASAAETSLATFPITTLFFGFAIDAASTTVFTFESKLVDLSTGDIVSINDQTGASTAGASSPNDLGALAFQPMSVTPQSIEADVKAAVASGAIDNAGVANSLLAKLDAAADARAASSGSTAGNHGCAVAAKIYQAFINEVTAEGASDPRPHIAQATAGLLISEARFLIANCP